MACTISLDGSTPIKERQEMIDRFSAEKTSSGSVNVFLLSTKAGMMMKQYSVYTPIVRWLGNQSDRSRHSHHARLGLQPGERQTGGGNISW